MHKITEATISENLLKNSVILELEAKLQSLEREPFTDVF